MKTITEFSGILLQRAAEAQRAYREAHPQVQAPAPESPAQVQSEPSPDAAAAVSAEVPVDEAVAGSVETTEASDPGEAAAPEAAAPEAAVAEGEGAAEVAEAAPVDLGSGPEAEAVGAELQLEGDRLSRLMEALDVVGRRARQVRLVRVVQGESPPQGAQKRGDFYYIVDLQPRPQSYRDGGDGRDDRRRGPGGRDRGGRPGGSGPGGAHGSGGGPGKGGKFSNDRPGGRGGDMREARGEMPRGGAGWMLTRAPDDRRSGPEGRGAGDNRGDRRPDRRPPRGPRPDNRGPRPDNRGPRPPMAGDRSARGPYPGAPGGQPPAGGGPGRSAAGPRDGHGPVGGRDGRPPRRPEGGNGRGRGGDRNNFPGRRRGGWDEPAAPEVVETSQAAPGAAPVPPETTPAAPPVETSTAAAATSEPVNTEGTPSET
jgi:hypothetical protein